MGFPYGPRTAPADEQSMKDLYSILGIPKDADQATIRKAYKKLARKYHPDLNKESGADDRFKEVTTAYEVLSDEQRRNLYDTFGAESLKQGFNPDAARQWRQATGGGFGGGHGAGGSPYGWRRTLEFLRRHLSEE